MGKKNWLMKTGFNLIGTGLTLFGLGGVAFLGDRLFSDNKDDDDLVLEMDEDNNQESNEDEGN